MDFTSKVKVTIFILMKTVKFICMGRNAGKANVETYRDRYGYTGTDRDGQGETGISRDKPFVPALSLLVLALYLLVPASPCVAWHIYE